VRVAYLNRMAYERALLESDAGALAEAARELDGVEADLALALRHLGIAVGQAGQRCSMKGISLPPSS
jgi:hypothetical protein